MPDLSKVMHLVGPGEGQDLIREALSLVWDTYTHRAETRAPELPFSELLAIDGLSLPVASWCFSPISSHNSH